MPKLRKGRVYQPIPNTEDKGYIALHIAGPGEFCGNTDYIVFVGGCGVGHASTLAAAKIRLLAEAKNTCLRRISAAQQQVHHYRDQLQKLDDEGLVRATQKDNTP